MPDGDRAPRPGTSMPMLALAPRSTAFMNSSAPMIASGATITLMPNAHRHE